LHKIEKLSFEVRVQESDSQNLQLLSVSHSAAHKKLVHANQVIVSKSPSLHGQIGGPTSVSQI
jgi:hypothetical protein